MGIELFLTLCVLVGAVALFVSEKWPVDVVALLVLGSLLVFGVVDPSEALSGFSSPANPQGSKDAPSPSRQPP